MSAPAYRPTYLLDHETLIERRHEVALIASALELDGSGWSGQGAYADISRLRAARRIAWTRWAVEVGELNEASYPGRLGSGDTSAESGGAHG